MVHSDTFRRMWSTTFREAIKCVRMFITKITLNKTIRYNVKLVASRCFFYFQHSIFEHTCVLANFKRHNLQFKLYFCITMYTVGALCLGCSYGAFFPGTLPQHQLFFFKINNQLLFEVSLILKDMYIISPFDRFVFYNIYSTFLKYDCRQFKLY